MIKSDFHVHTSFSTDSDTPAREQIEALINKGITEICITDHHDIGYTAMEKADVNTSESTNTNIESRPFRINPFAYYEDITLTQEEFYKKLREGGNISTSQPSPGSVTDLWDKILQEYDQIVHIPMSSGLSGSCQTAIMLAQEEEYDGKVYVVIISLTINLKWHCKYKYA